MYRLCQTLSGGEYQRVLLSRVIGNGLSDALYVLDEPSVGLGQHEIQKMIGCIRELRDLGNTILMVEHDKTLIRAADQIFELGPCGGAEGGYLIPVENQTPRPLKENSETVKPSAFAVDVWLKYLRKISIIPRYVAGTLITERCAADCLTFTR